MNVHDSLPQFELQSFRLEKREGDGPDAPLIETIEGGKDRPTVRILPDGSRHILSGREAAEVASHVRPQ